MKAENLVRYKSIVDKCDGIELKGKNLVYTSANGHMFSQINKAGEIGIRFSKEVQEKYFEVFDTTHFKSYGAIMKGYILIPDEILQQEEKMVALMQESLAYVLSLPPK